MATFDSLVPMQRAWCHVTALTFGCPNKASGLCRNFISQRTSRASWWPASGCGRSLISRTGRGGGHRPRLLLASLLWSSGLHLCDLHLWTASHERARSTLSSLGSSQARLIALLDGRYGCRRFQRRALIVGCRLVSGARKRRSASTAWRLLPLRCSGLRRFHS